MTSTFIGQPSYPRPLTPQQHIRPRSGFTLVPTTRRVSTLKSVGSPHLAQTCTSTDPRCQRHRPSALQGRRPSSEFGCINSLTLLLALGSVCPLYQYNGGTIMTVFCGIPGRSADVDVTPASEPIFAEGMAHFRLGEKAQSFWCRRT